MVLTRAVIAIALLASAAAAVSTPAPTPNSACNGVTETLSHFQTLYNAGKFDQLSDLLTSGVLFAVDGQPLLTGTKAVAAWWKALPLKQHMAWDQPIRVDSLGHSFSLQCHVTTQYTDLHDHGYVTMLWSPPQHGHRFWRLALGIIDSTAEASSLLRVPDLSSLSVPVPAMESNQDAKSIIDKKVATFMARYKARDWDGVADLYMNPSMVIGPHEEPARTHSEIAANFRASHEQGGIDSAKMQVYFAKATTDGKGIFEWSSVTFLDASGAAMVHGEYAVFWQKVGSDYFQAIDIYNVDAA